jgi:predicted nucleic acid-binding protein
MLVDRSSPEHEWAREFFTGWVQDDGAFVLLDVVFSEVVTAIKRREGILNAIKVGLELRTNRIYKWVEFDTEAKEESWLIFQEYDDKAWSFVDCSILAYARRSGISRVFAFDHHFEQMTDIECLP